MEGHRNNNIFNINLKNFEKGYFSTVAYNQNIFNSNNNNIPDRTSTWMYLPYFYPANEGDTFNIITDISAAITSTDGSRCLFFLPLDADYKYLNSSTDGTAHVLIQPFLNKDFVSYRKYGGWRSAPMPKDTKYFAIILQEEQWNILIEKNIT